MLKTVEALPDIQSEPSQQLKGTAGKENQPGAQVTGKPGTAQPEPTNNIHNQQDSKGANAGQFNLDPQVVQTRSQDSQVHVEGSEEVAPTRSNSESTLEVLKPIESIPDTEPGKQPKGAASHENGLATKPAEKGMDIQPSVVDNSRDLSQQVAVASTIAGNREIESGKGKTAGLVDKQAEVDARAMQERSLVQPGRVNHSLNTTKPEFEPTANDETGEKADATRKESPSVDVKKLIEFESHRLRGTKPNNFEGSRENLFKEGGDENRPNLNVVNRSDWEWLRSGIRTPGMETGSRFVTNTREIMDQVVKNAELLLRANVSELKVELKPEFLGRLTIKVALEDGVVIARLIAENQQVKHMLESNLASLKQSLESQGIKVERAEVSVQLNNGGMFDGSEDNRQYLWQEHQHSQQQSYKNWGDGVYSNEALEILESEGVVENQDYGINENGNLNFLI
jgi:flagellar hook-length control protein FliK